VDVAKVLSQLRAELQSVDAAILSLEKLATQTRRSGRTESGGVRRRGRPRKNAASGEVAAFIAMQEHSGRK